MPASVEPTQADYLELLVITDAIFREIYDWFFASVSDVIYGSTKVTDCIALAPFLVQCNVNLYFSDEAYVPAQEQLAEIAQEELKQGSNFHQQYLQKLRDFDTQVFSQATDVRYISSQEDLDLAMEEYLESQPTQTSKNGGSSLNIIIPVVIVAFLILLCVVLAYRRDQHRKTAALDRNTNIMKHKEDDVEDGTTAGDTYRTNAFTEDGVIGAYEDFRARKNKASKNLDEQMEQMIADLEEVSLASATSRLSGSGNHTSGSTRDDSDDDDEETVSVASSAAAVNPADRKTVLHDVSAKPAWAQRSSHVDSPRFEEPKSSEFISEIVPSSTRMSDLASVSIASKEKEAPLPTGPDRTIVGDFSDSTKKVLEIPVLQDQEENGKAELTSNKIGSTNKDLELPVFEVEEEPSVEGMTTNEIESTKGVLELPVLQDQEENSAEEKTEVPALQDEEEDKTTTIESEAEEDPQANASANETTEPLTAAQKVDGKPNWTKAQLRPVSSKTNKMQTEEQPSSEPAQPEWLLKFKQMGLDKTN